MELKSVSKGKDSLKIEVTGESHTFLNLLREKAWQSGCDQASYSIQHPYMSNPVIKIKAMNPVKVLADSCQKIIDECRDFSTQFSRVAGK